ncbi:MAG: helix-turn-helix domain-containing protein [Selenomonadaceae bacterium]|nr:helix-turn-helix domain-containing protein [Selenomonadaceae bacterium]
MRREDREYGKLVQDIKNFITEFYESKSLGFSTDIFENTSAPTTNSSGIIGMIKNIFAKKEDTFSEKLLKLIETKGDKSSEVYNRAGITRQHFSKIKKNADYQPTKETALAFALILHLDLDETKDLIGRAGFTLSPSNKRDLIIEYLIQRKIFDIDIVNDVLYDFEFSPLTNKRE